MPQTDEQKKAASERMKKRHRRAYILGRTVNLGLIAYQTAVAFYIGRKIAQAINTLNAVNANPLVNAIVQNQQFGNLILHHQNNQAFLQQEQDIALPLQANPQD